MKSKQAALITFLLISFPLILCAQFCVPDSSKMVTLRIDPTNAKGGLVSDVFSEVEFIPLETTKECLFGSIDNLNVVDGHFIFSDIDTRAVYIFDNNGKFIAKIDKNTTKLAGIDVDRNTFYNFEMVDFNGNQAIQLSEGKARFTFDLNGKLLVKTTIADDIKVSRKYNFKSSKDYVGIGVGDISGGKMTKAYEIGTFKNEDKTGQYFPIDLKDSSIYTFVPTRIGIFNSGSEKELFYLRKHDYQIYLATAEKLYIAYRFVFPQTKTLPKNFTTLEKSGDAIQWIITNDQVIYGIGNTFLLGNKLFFKAESMEGKNSLVYNLKDNNLTSLEDLAPDAVSQFLPISDSGVGNDFRRKGLQTFENGNFYTSYSALAFSKILTQTANKNLTLDPRLRKFSKERSRKDNPIIVRLKAQPN